MIEHGDVRAWRDAQKESGLSDKRVNNLLKYVSGPFTKAAHNPTLAALAFSSSSASLPSEE